MTGAIWNTVNGEWSAIGPKRTFLKDVVSTQGRSGSARQHILERIDGKTGGHRVLRARAGSRRNRRGCSVLQESVLGAADGERRDSPGVLGVLSEVPEQSVSGPPDIGMEAR
jgi:hypothetical protein